MERRGKLNGDGLATRLAARLAEALHAGAAPREEDCTQPTQTALDHVI